MPPTRFELFLDESGLFEETVRAPGQAKESSQRFPSQLAGILAPSGVLKEESAARVLTEVLAAAGMKPQGTLHASELRPGNQFDAAVCKLAEILIQRGWQAVRIVNKEGVSFGDRVANYTNHVAELCLRVFQELRLKGLKEVELALVCARVRVGESDDGTIALMEKPDYMAAIQAAMTRAALRAGRAASARGWHVVSVRLASARTMKELMLCDLVSNASHADFAKLGPEARGRLQQALERHDFSLLVREDLERVDTWIADGSEGFAIVHLADRLTDPSLDSTLDRQLRERLRKVTEVLARTGAPARNPQLEIVNASLEETIRWSRDLERGSRLVGWYRDQFLTGLTAELAKGGEDQEIAWFAHAIHDRGLEVHNHRGDLQGAHEALKRVHVHQDAMVRRWEHVDRFVQAQLHEAVHLTDARDFEAARDMALRVAQFHEQVGSLFDAALPGHFQGHVRSRRRGEALGVALQAEFYLGMERPQAFARARELSAQALEEFDQQADRQRQMQYRCQLEAMAGEFEAARRWLARAMELPEETTHQVLAQRIATWEGTTARGFLLLHWLRLGALMARCGAAAAGPLDAFRSALHASGIDRDAWVLHGNAKQHPRHAILRYRAEIALADADEVTALACLNRLREAALPIEHVGAVLGFQLFACQASLAAHFSATNLSRSKKLVEHAATDQPGLVQLLGSLRAVLGSFPGWQRILDEVGRDLCTTASGEAMGRRELTSVAARTNRVML